MISIVMPTYNQHKYIQEAIESIIKQTHKDWELIIINDGSTDNTLELIKPYLKDKRVNCITKTNGGTGNALNEGFKHTKGKYETWFASDNTLYPEALKTMYGVLETNKDIDYAYTDIDFTGCPESPHAYMRKSCKLSELMNPASVKYLINNFCLGIVWLWRKEIHAKVGEYQPFPCEDYDMALRMQEAGCRFGYIPEVLGKCRRHNETITFNEKISIPAFQAVINNAIKRRQKI